MVVLSSYRAKFRNISMERSNGVLEVRLHTNERALKWGINPGAVHEQLGEAFYAIGRDPDNRVMILTGTGDSFCAERNIAEYEHVQDAENVYRLIREGRDLLTNLLEIEVPVISAINGPVYIHPELAVLADVVLATPDTVFKDSHIANDNVPGDGAQVVWTALLGPTRGAYFLMTEELLDADEALERGVVHEIVARTELLPRARAIAERLASRSKFTLRYSRAALRRMLTSRMTSELEAGFTAEMLGVLSKKSVR
jgi:enoyl-CoA hydratase/carnithine racemase